MHVNTGSVVINNWKDGGPMLVEYMYKVYRQGDNSSHKAHHSINLGVMSSSNSLLN